MQYIVAQAEHKIDRERISWIPWCAFAQEFISRWDRFTLFKFASFSLWKIGQMVRFETIRKIITKFPEGVKNYREEKSKRKKQALFFCLFSLPNMLPGCFHFLFHPHIYSTNALSLDWQKSTGFNFQDFESTTARGFLRYVTLAKCYIENIC